ncbi:MinD/ParA family protein [Streptomyces sp. NBC_00986]|uniref:MinD/ParA family ATP-binding protein n=1 Tax=Streptomyces sp. NBC_00986 TaxID=2903702 RepID=UPI00386DF43B|nr:hypothetical protein OG504_13390 [Streptomyces sp. NBC_00986]
MTGRRSRDRNSHGERELGRPWSAAIVSPRAGDGATLVTAAAGALIDAVTGPQGQNVILMDADLHTAGLTALLGAWHAVGTEDGYGTGPSGDDGRGLTGFALERDIALCDRSVQGRLQELRSPDGRSGDMSLLAVRAPGSAALAELSDLPRIMGRAVELLAELAGCLLVDCGPGWNPRTRRICETVEYVFMVGREGARAHPDTLRLAEHLTESGLLSKTIGYVANTPEQKPEFTRRSPQLAGHSPKSAVGGSHSEGTLPVRTIIDLPYDPRAAQTLGHGKLSGPQSPFENALCTGMEALEPDLFRTGFDIG